ncbi:UNVERIFIED_CONTAM: hypothetical protein K2H54_004981 [Gekko kuhli]
MNMPEVDSYGTVQPHTLIRQHLDYGHWYDRNKLSLKEIMNVQYVSCMNPTAGSFTINPRLQRHFSVFALSFPGSDALSSIYSMILTQHLKRGNFPGALQKSSQQLINLALALHLKVAATFLPTAIKFHYNFNLRDLSNVFQVPGGRGVEGASFPRGPSVAVLQTGLWILQLRAPLLPHPWAWAVPLPLFYRGLDIPAGSLHCLAIAVNLSTTSMVLTVGVPPPEHNLCYLWAWPHIGPTLNLSLETLEPELHHASLAVCTIFSST